MLVSKLLDGVVIVERGSSRRAFRPKFLHRILLAWVFRYFASLPLVVLPGWQKALIAVVIARGMIAPLPDRDSDTIIGTVENATAPAVEAQPVSSSPDWEYASRRPAGDRISA